jgi:hypothetical protein
VDLKITGTQRDIVNAGLGSGLALCDATSPSRTDSEVDRAIDLLVDNLHTSPFESVTMTFSWDEGEGLVGMDIFLYNKYSRVRVDRGTYTMTMDLWSFARASLSFNGRGGHTDLSAWKLFELGSPVLASKVEKFNLFGQKVDNFDDICGKLGVHNMSVKLVSHHDAGSDSQSRATWRVECPLSTAVQVLEYGGGSITMARPRDEMIGQEFISKFDDISEIFGKVVKHNFGETACGSVIFDIHRSTVFSVMDEYYRSIKSSRRAERGGAISSDEHDRLKEVAGYILPEGRMVELYVSFYIDDFTEHLETIDSANTQLEHQWITMEMRKSLVECQNIKID